MTKYGTEKKARRFAELYETPAAASLPVIDRLGLQGTVWEPFAGSGKICRALALRGYSVIASDIMDYGYPLDFQGDFFDLSEWPQGADHVLTNPPYGKQNRLVVPIVRKLLAMRKVGGVIVLLLPSEFDFGATRSEIFGGCPLYRGQIKIMGRIRWVEGSGGSGTENHAWHAWGPPNWTWKHCRLRMPVVDYVRLAG